MAAVLAGVKRPVFGDPVDGERYRRVFRNQDKSTDLVISRRWTALQAPGGVVTTIRFRDPAAPVALLS